MLAAFRLKFRIKGQGLTGAGRDLPGAPYSREKIGNWLGEGDHDLLWIVGARSRPACFSPAVNVMNGYDQALKIYDHYVLRATIAKCIQPGFDRSWNSRAGGKSVVPRIARRLGVCCREE